MAAKPKVSVITPTYNHERFIGECIRSVLNQSFQDWEMIVVDDGSTDGTPFVAKQYPDPRIRTLRQANKGLERLGETYNAALDQCEGTLVAILEGDDYWPAGKLERQVPDFEDEQVVLSGGRVQVVDESGAELSVAPLELPPVDALRNEPVGRASFWMLDPFVLTFTFPVTVMIRRAALDAIGGFRQPSGLPLVDYPTLIRLGLEGPWRFHDEILGCWRRHGQSTTLGRAGEIFDGVYAAAEEFCEEFRTRLPATDEEIERTDERWQHFQAERLISLGRLLGARRRRREAVRAFAQALRFRLRPRTRAMVRIASVLSALGQSPEAAFRLSKRGSDHQMSLASGDSLVSEGMRPEAVVPRRLRA
jgi:glycosyltransferase involved in cell wall biosynthesis